jgi:hypothetical protein
MEPPPGYVVDHIDGDPLNNRRDNMRIVTSSENSWNQKISKANKSGYKGVCFAAREGRWRAQIRKNKRQYMLGYFKDPADAAAAYAAASAELHGEHGRLR